MFDDLTLDQLKTMRTNLREALVALATGKQTAEVRYGETGRKFHPADPAATQAMLNRVIAAIEAREVGGRRSGAIFPRGV
jgi:hypothetical protein